MRWLGAARRAHDIARRPTRRGRGVFGSKLVNHEGVGFHALADNEIDIRMSRLAIWHTAWVLDQGSRGFLESSIAKVFCSEAIWRSGRSAACRCISGQEASPARLLVERTSSAKCAPSTSMTALGGAPLVAGAAHRATGRELVSEQFNFSGTEFDRWTATLFRWRQKILPRCRDWPDGRPHCRVRDIVSIAWNKGPTACAPLTPEQTGDVRLAVVEQPVMRNAPW